MVPPLMEFGPVSADVLDDVRPPLLPPPPLPPPPLRLVSCFAESAIALRESGRAKAWIVVKRVMRKRIVCESFMLSSLQCRIRQRRLLQQCILSDSDTVPRAALNDTVSFSFVVCRLSLTGSGLGEREKKRLTVRHKGAALS